MSEQIEPIYAQGFFVVNKNGLVNQIIIFDYFDPESYYYNLIDEEDRLSEELEILRENMQAMLDSEKILINNEKVKPKVMDVDLDFRGSPLKPYFTFFIIFKGSLRKGVNVYENWYESEEAEYDFNAYWIFPENSEIREVSASGLVEVLNERNILVIRVKRGEHITGYEKIVFELP